MYSICHARQPNDSLQPLTLFRGRRSKLPDPSFDGKVHYCPVLIRWTSEKKECSENDWRSHAFRDESRRNCKPSIGWPGFEKRLLKPGWRARRSRVLKLTRPLCCEGVGWNTVPLRATCRRTDCASSISTGPTWICCFLA